MPWYNWKVIYKDVLVTSYLYYISQCLFVCMYVCMLPFFSATAEPFALKLGMVF